MELRLGSDGRGGLTDTDRPRSQLNWPAGLVASWTNSTRPEFG